MSDNIMAPIAEAPFSANFRLYDPEGVQVQFTVRAADAAAHLAELAAYRAALIAQGYANELPGLDENEKVEEVAAYVRGATKAGQPLVWLYSAKEVLKWRLTTVYEERLAELPFPIMGNVWPGAAAPEREEALAKGYLQAIQPTKIVLESTETDENGKRRWKFARLYAAPAPTASAPATNGNGHAATAQAPANGNGHAPTVPATNGNGHTATAQAPVNGNGHAPTVPATNGNGHTATTPACPKCGGPMWDNRASKRNPAAPDYKCKDKTCAGVIWPPKNGGNGVQAPAAAASPARNVPF